MLKKFCVFALILASVFAFSFGEQITLTNNTDFVDIGDGYSLGVEMTSSDNFLVLTSPEGGVTEGKVSSTGGMGLGSGEKQLEFFINSINTDSIDLMVHEDVDSKFLGQEFDCDNFIPVKLTDFVSVSCETTAELINNLPEITKVMVTITVDGTSKTFELNHDNYFVFDSYKTMLVSAGVPYVGTEPDLDGASATLIVSKTTESNTEEEEYSQVIELSEHEKQVIISVNKKVLVKTTEKDYEVTCNSAEDNTISISVGDQTETITRTELPGVKEVNELKITLNDARNSCDILIGTGYPTAVITHKTICENNNCRESFSAKDSYDSNGRIIKYSWRVLDENGEPNVNTGKIKCYPNKEFSDCFNLKEPEFIFTEKGDYIVSLGVQNAQEKWSSANIKISVEEPQKIIEQDIETEPFNAIIQGYKKEFIENQEITLDGSSSQGEIVSYEWSFNPAINCLIDDCVNTPTPKFTLPQTGKYFITLTIFDGQGNTDTTTKNIWSVTGYTPNEKPVAKISFLSKGQVVLGKTVYVPVNTTLKVSSEESTTYNNEITAEGWDIGGAFECITESCREKDPTEFKWTEKSITSFQLWVQDNYSRIDTEGYTVMVGYDAPEVIENKAKKLSDNTYLFYGGTEYEENGLHVKLSEIRDYKKEVVLQVSMNGSTPAVEKVVNEGTMISNLNIGEFSSVVYKLLVTNVSEDSVEMIILTDTPKEEDELVLLSFWDESWSVSINDELLSLIKIYFTDKPKEEWEIELSGEGKQRVGSVFYIPGPNSTGKYVKVLDAEYNGELDQKVLLQILEYNPQDREEKTAQPTIKEITKSQETEQRVMEGTNKTQEKLIKNQSVCFGCSYQENCLPTGTRINNLYCDFTQKLRAQKVIEEACENNYECKSNQCLNNVCVDVYQELQKTQGVVEKILKFLMSFFNFG